MAARSDQRTAPTPGRARIRAHTSLKAVASTAHLHPAKRCTTSRASNHGTRTEVLAPASTEDRCIAEPAPELPLGAPSEIRDPSRTRAREHVPLYLGRGASFATQQPGHGRRRRRARVRRSPRTVILPARTSHSSMPRLGRLTACGSAGGGSWSRSHSFEPTSGWPASSACRV